MRYYLPKIRLTLFAFTALVILWLSLSPHPPLPTAGLFSWDKAQHALAYAGLALVGGWALRPMMSDPLAAWRRGAWIAVVYGALLELAQMYLTRIRSGQVSDAVADALGALVVYLAARWVVIWRETRRCPEGDR